MRRAVLTSLAVVALAAGLLPLGASAAIAAVCPSPGGAGMPAHRDVPPGEVQILGRGWGHGVGMSQYGARGAARLGCTAEEILGTYYPGTALTARASIPVTVGLFPDRAQVPGAPHLDVVARSGSATWQTAAGPLVQPQGTTWRAVVEDGRLQVRDLTADGPPRYEGAAAEALRIPLQDERTIQLPQKATNAQWPGGRPYRRGTLRITPIADAAPQLRVELELPDVEQYLYGLAEMPSSWELQALRAQAIAGRSYVTRAGGRVWDSPSSQVYSGFLKESESVNVGGGQTAGQRWVQAVETTRGAVLTYQGEIAQTYYSSSHGGQSESNRFSAFFSPTAAMPYLRPLDDSRWEAAADSPVATWAYAFSRDQAGQALGVGRLLRVTLREPRGAGGRVGVPGRPVYSDPSRTYGGVEVVGTAGTRVVSGLDFMNAFVQAFGIPRRSELFEVRVDVDACLPDADQSGNTVVTRSAGPSRVETSVAVSADHWDEASDVVLATAGGYADALSAAALAARLDAPLLLTGGDRLAPAVRAELARLGPERVHLMGGGAALSGAVEDEIRSAGYGVARVAGADRFATARAAALAAGPSPSGDVAVALGTSWPDAVSAGTLAGSGDRVPTLLATATGVPAPTLQGLRDLQARRVILIGGTGVIGEAVADRLRGEGYDVTRVAGPNRFATSVEVAEDALGRAGGTTRPVLLASGAAFPDALAAGALSARLDAPVVLVPRCGLSEVPPTAVFLRDAPFDRGVIVGGTAAVSDRVREEATLAIRG